MILVGVDNKHRNFAGTQLLGIRERLGDTGSLRSQHLQHSNIQYSIFNGELLLTCMSGCAIGKPLSRRRVLGSLVGGASADRDIETAHSAASKRHRCGILWLWPGLLRHELR